MFATFLKNEQGGERLLTSTQQYEEKKKEMPSYLMT